MVDKACAHLPQEYPHLREASPLIRSGIEAGVCAEGGIQHSLEPLHDHLEIVFVLLVFIFVVLFIYILKVYIHSVVHSLVYSYVSFNKYV